MVKSGIINDFSINMFRGEFPVSMDNKGRIAVPTRYRDRLIELCDGKLVITISLMERCLIAYPYARWQDIENQLTALPALDRQAQALNHLLIGHANECDMDGNGRLLIPSSLREFAQLDKKLRLVGQMGKFELWDENVWNIRREELLTQISSLQDEPSDALQALVL